MIYVLFCIFLVEKDEVVLLPSLFYIGGKDRALCAVSVNLWIMLENILHHL